MKHLALSYALRRALNGGRNCNRHGLAVVRQLPATEVRRFVVGGENGVFSCWNRMMSSQAAPEEEKKEEKAEKESLRTEAKKSDGSVVVSSYWGISRPKITREDGTEWPWNCFMVRILII